MKPKFLSAVPFVIFLLICSSCEKDDWFEQPTVTVTGYTLLDLPGEYTNLEIDIRVSNNDTKEANIGDVIYTVVIEGVEAEQEEVEIGKRITVDEPLLLSLPLTLRTSEAVELLSKLDAGEELEYSVTGVFHLDDPIIRLIDLPIDISGTAVVDVGFEDFFMQPEVSVNEISGDFETGEASYTFEFYVDCTVENREEIAAVIDEVEYVVVIEGVESDTHLYTDTYDIDFSIDALGSRDLVLPVRLQMDAGDGAALSAAILEGVIEYEVEGTFHVKEAGGNASDFSLPLYLKGSMNADIVEDLFEQPEVSVNSMDVGYTINGFTSYTFNIDANCTVENLDARDVVIDEVDYVVTVEGVASDSHKYSDSYAENLSIAAGTSANLTLPVTMNVGVAAGAGLVTALADGTASYVITGTFHVVEVDGVAADFTLPLNVTGSVPVTMIGK